MRRPRILGTHGPLLLLAFPACSGWLACAGHGFPFKAGVAAGCALLVALCRGRGPSAVRGVWLPAAALLLSIAGDWFLSNRGGSGSRFLYGIALFFLAHAGFLAFSLRNGSIRWIPTAALLAGYLALFAFRFLPYLRLGPPALLAAVLAYLILSCLSLGAAAGIALRPAPRWIYTSGIAMLLFSDTLIGFGEFTAFRGWRFLVLPTYYLSQLGIAAALMVQGLGGGNGEPPRPRGT